ncbi:MAG TPA: L-lactate permease, partial [Planctomycetaceae bacterium]|nr:L-lactate permease [Planctomycetaceae bacterium]
VLFGNLQRVAAGRIGVSPILTAAANSSGGVMGKMIDAQSLVVASVATSTTQSLADGTTPDSKPDDQPVSAADALRYVFLHSLALAVLVGLLVLLQAYVVPGMVP